MAHAAIFESKDRQKIQKLEEKMKEEKKRGSNFSSRGSIGKAKNANNYLSQFVLFAAQCNMFLGAYMYHSSAGFVALCWLIFSFIASTTTTLFVSIVIMIPIGSWEFIFIYCSRVPKISRTQFF
jgi:hypothetical protein